MQALGGFPQAASSLLAGVQGRQLRALGEAGLIGLLEGAHGQGRGGQGVQQLDGGAGFQIQQAPQGRQGREALGLGLDQALPLGLQLQLGPQGIQAGAHALLLLVLRQQGQGLGQLHPGLASSDGGLGPQGAQVLAHHQGGDLFAHGAALGPGRVLRMLGGAPALPQGQVKERHMGLNGGLAPVEGTHHLGPVGRGHTNERVHVVLGPLPVSLGRHRRHQGRGRHPPIVATLGQSQHAEVHPGVLVQGTAQGLGQGEGDGRPSLRLGGRVGGSGGGTPQHQQGNRQGREHSGRRGGLAQHGNSQWKNHQEAVAGRSALASMRWRRTVSRATSSWLKPRRWAFSTFTATGGSWGCRSLPAGVSSR